MPGLAVSDVMTAKFEGSSFQYQIIKIIHDEIKTVFYSGKKKSFHKTIISGYCELSVLI